MPRKRGSKNKSTLIKEGSYEKPDTRTDSEIVNDIRKRFDIYYQLIRGTTENAITAAIVSGSAGIGKSYTAEWALENARDSNGIRFRIVRGTISALDLYQLAYEYCGANCVIVLDDADRIFDDEEGLNILKSLLDTSVVRKVNWMTDHPRFKGQDALPKEFEFRGSMVFLTNRNFQDYIDHKVGKHVDHMQALMSRSMYLDLKMHTRREVALWTRHIVIRNKILRQIGISENDEGMLVDWIVSHQKELRELSIRTALKLGKIFLMNPDNWKDTAEILLIRN